MILIIYPYVLFLFITVLVEIEIEGIRIRKAISVNYDRTGNVLIGMDILSQMDIHIGKSKILDKTVLLACPYNMLHATGNEKFPIMGFCTLCGQCIDACPKHALYDV